MVTDSVLNFLEPTKYYQSAVIKQNACYRRMCISGISFITADIVSPAQIKPKSVESYRTIFSLGADVNHVDVPASTPLCCFQSHLAPNPVGQTRGDKDRVPLPRRNQVWQGLEEGCRKARLGVWQGLCSLDQ